VRSEWKVIEKQWMKKKKKKKVLGREKEVAVLVDLLSNLRQWRCQVPPPPPL
jgi:hypothetical protein